MSAKPWEASGSFHIWFVDQVDAIVDGIPPTISISGRKRLLDEDDFGYNYKTLESWRRNTPKEYPDGRKMMGIVMSEGFKYLNPAHQHAIIDQWISVELNGQSLTLTDELIGVLLKMVEKSSVDFLKQCLDEIQD